VLDDDVRIHSMFRDQPVESRDAAVAHFVRTTTTFALAMPLVGGPAVADDGTVLAEVDFVGTFTGTLLWHGTEHVGAGERFRVPGVVVLHTQDDRVRSVRTLYDREDWLRQIGVAPVGNAGAAPADTQTSHLREGAR
jgi:hypothetical protein